MTSPRYTKCCGLCANWNRGNSSQSTFRRCDNLRVLTCYGEVCDNFELDRKVLRNVITYKNKNY